MVYQVICLIVACKCLDDDTYYNYIVFRQALNYGIAVHKLL